MKDVWSPERIEALLLQTEIRSSKKLDDEVLSAARKVATPPTAGPWARRLQVAFAAGLLIVMVASLWLIPAPQETVIGGRDDARAEGARPPDDLASALRRIEELVAAITRLEAEIAGLESANKALSDSLDSAPKSEFFELESEPNSEIPGLESEPKSKGDPPGGGTDK